MGDAPGPRFSSLFAVVLATVFSSACVAGADRPSPTDPHLTTTTSPPTTTTTVTLEEGLANFRDCLADSSVRIPEIELDGRGRPQLSRAMAELDMDDRLVLAAVVECSPELASGSLDLTPDSEMRELVVSALGQFAACVRGYGVPDFPDPAPTFNGVGPPFSESRIPWNDEDLSSAVIICNRELVRRP